MEELLKSLQELLAIESVARRDQEKPFGNGVAQALDYTLSLCQRMGFHTKNADGLYGYAEIGEGAEIIGCLGHLDVVPAGDGWHYPPYAGTIDGGRLYGRGTIDDKGPTLIALFAAHDVAQAYERAGKPMPRRIRFIFGQTEESGPWDDMAAYVAHEEPVRFGFTPDADFPAIYCEKGILRLHLTMPLTGSGILDAKGGTVVNSPDSGPLSMNVGLLRVEDGLIRLSVDIRHPETAAADHIAETVRRAVEPYGFTLAPIHPEKSVYQDKNGPVMQSLLAAYRQETGDLSAPLAIGGGTYAKAMENIIAFGPVFPGEESREHQADEYIALDNIERLRRIYAQAFQNLLAL